MTSMDEGANLVGVIVAFFTAVGALVATIWRGGRLTQRIDTMERDVEAMQETQREHAAGLSDGKARFAVLETKIDLVLSQQRQTLARLDTLAERKD